MVVVVILLTSWHIVQSKYRGQTWALVMNRLMLSILWLFYGFQKLGLTAIITATKRKIKLKRKLKIFLDHFSVYS